MIPVLESLTSRLLRRSAPRNDGYLMRHCERSEAISSTVGRVPNVWSVPLDGVIRRLRSALHLQQCCSRLAPQRNMLPLMRGKHEGGSGKADIERGRSRFGYPMSAASPTRRSSKSSVSPASTPPSSTWSTPASTCTMRSSRLWQPSASALLRSFAHRASTCLHTAAVGHGSAGYPSAALQQRSACEDRAAIELIDEIAGVKGIDLLAVGPADLSRSLWVSGQPGHPRLVAAIDRVREAVKKGAGARLALPLNHAALPRNAAQLRRWVPATPTARRPRKLACRSHCKPSSLKPASFSAN